MRNCETPDGTFVYSCSVDLIYSPIIYTFGQGTVCVKSIRLGAFVFGVGVKDSIFLPVAGLDAIVSKIDISINNSSIGLLIMVTDDGVGMSKAFKIEKRRGDGLRILDNYMMLFNRQHKHSVSYKIIDCTNLETDQTGTRILITIKD